MRENSLPPDTEQYGVSHGEIDQRSTYYARRKYYSTRNHVHIMNSHYKKRVIALKAAGRAIGKTPWHIRTKGLRAGLRFSYFQVRAVFDAYFSRMGRTIGFS